MGQDYSIQTNEHPFRVFRRSRHIRFAVLAAAIFVHPVYSIGAESPEIETESVEGNRLANETSPYLLQHAGNPVEWYPWGDDAFEKAQREDKPVFLSVGYSTCYWCHVMARESFADEEVAEILNRDFVSVKVDREERPDVDQHFMLATQLIARRGGWPNSVWLTPEGKPWMAGTYFPKDQFIETLEHLARSWTGERDAIEEYAATLEGYIREASSPPDERLHGELSKELVSTAVRAIMGAFDPEFGGFGSAPKFPPHAPIRLLLQHHSNERDEEILEAVTRTLDGILLGGIRDHVGGGFHRYSTDERWLLPHFEKMLYDNAQLLYACTEAYRLTGGKQYREAVEEIFFWLEHEMTAPEGGFYSAIDAGEPGSEGEYYLWRTEEVLSILGEDDGHLFTEVYNFETGGNFRDEVSGERTGMNIPHLTQPIQAHAVERGEAADDLHTRLRELREDLREQRRDRPFPHVDDKILAGWNGLMIEALAHAGNELQDERYVRAASRAADFILEKMFREETLFRVHREGESAQPGYLDDHAYLASGLLALHRTTGEERWLEQARQLADIVLRDFSDEAYGGFFIRPRDTETVIAPSKGLFGRDNTPNPNAVTAGVMLALAEATGDSKYRDAAQNTLESFGAWISRADPTGSEDLLAIASRFMALPGR